MLGFQHFLSLFAIFVCLSCEVGCKPLDRSDSIFFPGDHLPSASHKFQSRILEPTKKLTNFDPGLKTIKTSREEELVVKPALENGKFFQGDMILQPDQMEFLRSNVTDKESLVTRTGLLHETYRWPKNKAGRVAVAYEIADYHFSEFHLAFLSQVVELFRPVFHSATASGRDCERNEGSGDVHVH